MDTNIIIAICALAVSLVATAFAIWSAFLQRRHMRLSVRPIASFPVADFEDRVGVFLSNNGLGPMRIKKFIAEKSDGTVYGNIISHMPPLVGGIIWNNFYQSVDGATIEKGKRLDLLLLEGDPNDGLFCSSRDDIRRTLKDLTIRVEYEDLYGKAMKPFERALSWFGRHDN